MTTGQSWVRPSSPRDAVDQERDLVPDAACAVGAEVREVLAHLCRVDAGQHGEALRRDRVDVPLGDLEQRAVVQRKARNGRTGDLPPIGGRAGPLRHTGTFFARGRAGRRARSPTVHPPRAVLHKRGAAASGAPSRRTGPASPRAGDRKTGGVRSACHGRRARLPRHRGGDAVRPGDARALHPGPPPPGPGVDDRPGPLRPGLGRAGHRGVDRLGQRDLPGLLPPRRGAVGAVAGARHRPSPRSGPRSVAGPSACSCS